MPLCLGNHEVLAREDPQHHSLTRLIRCSSTNCFEWVRPDIHRTVQWLNDPEEYPMLCTLHNNPPSDSSPAAAAVTKSPRSQVKSRPRNDDNDDGGIEILNLVPTHLIPATPKYTVGLDMATLVARSTQRLAAVGTKPTSTLLANNSNNKKGSTNKTLVFEGRPPKRRAAVAAEDEIAAAAVSTVEAGHSAKRRAAKSIDLNDSDSDSDVPIDNDNGQDESFDYNSAHTGDNDESSDDDDQSDTAPSTRRTRTRSAKKTLNWKSTPVLDIVINEDSVAPLSKFNKPSKPSS